MMWPTVRVIRRIVVGEKVVTTVPITQSQAKREIDDTEEAEDVKESEAKRKKSEEAQKAVI
eukprot:9677737-Ditylum_brightwellii.AAC.1